MGTCCSISELIDPWTTVTVYNQLNHSEYQVSRAPSSPGDNVVLFVSVIITTGVCCVPAEPYGLDPGGRLLCEVLWLVSGSELLRCGQFLLPDLLHGRLSKVCPSVCRDRLKIRCEEKSDIHNATFSFYFKGFSK